MPIINSNEITVNSYLPEISGRFFNSQNSSFSFTQFSSGAESPNHRHPFEQVMIILKGSMEFQLEDERKIMGEGGVMIVPPDTVHQCVALTDCSVLEIFQNYD